MDDAFAHIAKVDRKMARLIERVGPFEPEKKTADPFQALVRSIVYQQLTGKAAGTIMQRVVALAATPGSKRFPAAEAFGRVTDAELRAAGLSGAKTAYLRDLCRAANEGLLPSPRALKAMDDDAIVDALTAIKGIGRWSVEMLLIFNLGRLDVLPATDYGVRKGFAKVYGKKELPLPREILAFGERWRPYRTVPSWYLWRATELED